MFRKIILFLIGFLLVSCSHYTNNITHNDKNLVGIDYIFKKHKIKVIDERDINTQIAQKFFKKEEALNLSLENVINVFGEKTDYKNQIIIEKGDILNPKIIRIKK